MKISKIYHSNLLVSENFYEINEGSLQLSNYILENISISKGLGQFLNCLKCDISFTHMSIENSELYLVDLRTNLFFSLDICFFKNISAEYPFILLIKHEYDFNLPINMSNSIFDRISLKNSNGSVYF